MFTRQRARIEVNSLEKTQLVVPQKTAVPNNRRRKKLLIDAMEAGQSTPNNELIATPCKVEDKLQWPPEQIKPIALDAHVKKCLTCSSVLRLVQGTESQSSPVAQCLICPARPFICGTCLSPWHGPPGAGEGYCANDMCAMVGTLLNCELITDPKSKVKGCPLFRACPKCHSLLMHHTGCKYVTCQQCRHALCYICLCDKAECMNESSYWALSCSKPTAGRQQLST